MFEIMLGNSRRKDGIILPANLGPGPTELIGKNDTAGFFGEVSIEELIDGLELASVLKLTAGTAHHSDSGWLKFILDGTILYIAKRSYRYNLTPANLIGANVLTGVKTITIGENLFKVRVPKGVKPGHIGDIRDDRDSIHSHGSEWNRLMYHISKDINRGKMTSEGITTGDWASYSEEDLLTIQGRFGNKTICQEYAGLTTISGYDYPAYAYRGTFGVSYLGRLRRDKSDNDVGWRPVLELVS